MTKQEFSNIASALRTYYPKENILPNLPAMELWYRETCDIDYQVMELAVRKWVATNKWSPSIAELREICAEITKEEIKDWGAAWESVMTAVSRYGFYRPQEAMDSLDDLTRRCVQRIGFTEICNSENIAADRANFRMIYEQLQSSQKNENRMQPALTEQIEHVHAIAMQELARLEGKAQNGLLTEKVKG